MKSWDSETLWRQLCQRCKKKRLILTVSLPVILLCAAVIPAVGAAPGRVSGSFGIGPVYGFTMSRVVATELPDYFDWTNPRYHMAFGADITLTYVLSKQRSVSLRNISDWYRPGFSMIVNDELLLSGAYAFSAANAGFFVGAGVGIDFYVFPFDTFWNNNYGGIGPSGNIVIGYRVKDRYTITLENSANFPKSKKERISLYDPPNYAHINYLVNQIRFLIHFNLF
jgi:hypothetical protein